MYICLANGRALVAAIRVYSDASRGAASIPNDSGEILNNRADHCLLLLR